MLAPVLARLDAIPGVTAARVDSSGRFFWLPLGGGADAHRVTTLAESVLGNGSRVLSAAQAEAQLAAHQRGDPWLTANEVMALSFVESRILSVRLAGEVERQTGATPEQREVIAEAIRSELFVAVECVHAEGGRRSSGWLYEAWPSIGSAAVQRCAHAIPPLLGERLAALLPARTTRRCDIKPRRPSALGSDNSRSAAGWPSGSCRRLPDFHVKQGVILPRKGLAEMTCTCEYGRVYEPVHLSFCRFLSLL